MPILPLSGVEGGDMNASRKPGANLESKNAKAAAGAASDQDPRCGSAADRRLSGAVDNAADIQATQLSMRA